MIFSCSVDDGHPADMRLAHYLARHGIAATFYLPINNVEGLPVLHGAQVRELAQGFEIGSHTHDHCFLSRLDDRQAQWQVERGKSALEQILGQGVAGFCYPGGKYRPVHVQMVRAAGFDYARTTRNLDLGPGPSRFELATSCQFYAHSRAVYLRNFIRGGHWLRRGPLLLDGLRQREWQARLQAMLEHALLRGGVFHLWLHSVDIERLGAWAALDAFLRRVAGAVPPGQRWTNARLAAHYFPSEILI
jgi:peptidoglycan/xylan/chitin deacetylase (PgdA/CDA1 family)